MAYTLQLIASAKKAETDAVLHDDVVSRQSQTIRDAPSMGGPSGHLYVLVEGSDEGVRRAEELLKPLAEPMTAADREALHRRLQEERDSASAGMGLFFTE
jgi:hypothetical protein